MATYANTTKTSAATLTNVGKSVTTFFRYMKGGEGVPYDSPAAYNDELDPISGNHLTYNTSGTAPTWTNIAKI